jgi:hypothetical protein
MMVTNLGASAPADASELADSLFCVPAGGGAAGVAAVVTTWLGRLSARRLHRSVEAYACTQADTCSSQLPAEPDDPISRLPA